MCLGIPGKIIEKFKNGDTRMGKVDFDGVQLDVCLEATPEADLGDYVIVHAGFAISTLTHEEAQETLEILREIDALQSDEENQSES
jgi:hydrogenase expression/formation protein HypC